MQVIPVKRESNRLNLVEWRSSKELVGAAQRIYSDPDFRMMLQVMANEHPAYTVFAPDIRSDMRMAHQAKCEGYTLALANLESMTSLKKLVEMSQPTYEPEEKE